MQKTSKVYIAGARGMVGSAIVRCLHKQGYTNVISSDYQDFDLTNAAACDAYFETNKPEFVVLAAAKVGGIVANDTYPADFIRVNLQIQINIIDCCFRHKVKKLLFLGSSCIYPKLAPQPMKEEYILSGKLEPTNDAYALAKIAGIIMCKSYNRQHGTNFIAAMPTNLFGPGDNFNLKDSHVIPAMIRKFHEGKIQNAPSVELWGTGTPRREFVYVEDLAEALVYMLEKFEVTPGAREEEKMFMNVGVGSDITIKELALMIKDIVGFKGEIVWNSAMPDGTPRKLLDVHRLTELGWKAKTTLPEALKLSYQWFLDNWKDARK
eukprot:RCo033816